jgi:hypothetical protein
MEKFAASADGETASAHENRVVGGFWQAGECGLLCERPAAHMPRRLGGGLKMETDLALDPAGNVWVMNNWEDIGACFHRLSEALSTRCGGNGVMIFYGMAKPMRAPMIGPARPVL